MEFKQLQSYIEVVRNLSFTKASRTLFISQPTISMHIRQLESELGVRLIVRTTKSIEVTPIGRELYDYAVNMLAMRDRCITNCSANRRRILSLGASTIPSAYILPEILPEFGRKYPDIFFVIHQSDSRGVMEKLLDGTFDLGLTGMAPNDPALIKEPLCSDRIVLITPVNDHFLAWKEQGGDILSLLKQEPLIMREEGSGSEKKAEEFLSAAGVLESDLHITARANDQEAIKNMVAGGMGISLISELAARSFIKEKRLIAFDLPDVAARRTFYLVYRADYTLQNELKIFIRFLKQNLSV